MDVLIDERHLPAILTTPPMTDEQFAELCAEHEDLVFEMTADGELIVMPLPFSDTAYLEEDIHAQLRAWAQGDGGGIATGANLAFAPPRGARRAPGGAWIHKSKMPASRGKYWAVCPDFAIERKSASEELPGHRFTGRAEMAEWIEDGAQLGWLIDSQHRVVEIYRRGLQVSTVTPGDKLTGGPPVKTFVLDLRPIWDLQL